MIIILFNFREISNPDRDRSPAIKTASCKQLVQYYVHYFYYLYKVQGVHNMTLLCQHFIFMYYYSCVFYLSSSLINILCITITQLLRQNDIHKIS